MKPSKLPRPHYRGHGVEIYVGDAVEVLRALPGESFDALVTDPPYSSGGLHAGDRARPVGQKYCNHDKGRRFANADFAGDHRDQRSHLAWSIVWLSIAVRRLRPSSYAMLFSDWRQLPLTTDALQGGGLHWRGIVAWNKRNGRPAHRGYLRPQCEYIAWATLGKCPKPDDRGPWPGYLEHTVYSMGKNHPTAKPLPLMIEVVAPVCLGGRVLDPFAGGGATLAACVATGRSAVGIELSAEYADAAADLVEATARAGAA
ncbi:MAG: DNA methyltransferase [Planctomycetota bacterium]